MLQAKKLLSVCALPNFKAEGIQAKTRMKLSVFAVLIIFKALFQITPCTVHITCRLMKPFLVSFSFNNAVGGAGFSFMKPSKLAMGATQVRTVICCRVTVWKIAFHWEIWRKQNLCVNPCQFEKRKCTIRRCFSFWKLDCCLVVPEDQLYSRWQSY